MKKYFFALLLVSISKMAIAQESLADKVRHAFSLVGHWEIIKMDVIRISSVTNPNTIPEAALGKVSITIQSELGSYGSFDIAPGGSINGNGEAQYTYMVSAGSTAFSMPGMPFSLPVGASAIMEGDDGVRKFSITGSADLVNRTISLNAFKADGGGLKMMIHPGNKSFDVSLWPPMTNVESKVIVTGASLLLRASGVLSGIKVSFEAVKYVDLASLFTSIEDLVKNGPNGKEGPKGEKGDKGDKGVKGDKGDNGVNGKDGAKGDKGDKGDNGNNSNNGAGNQGPQALVAGSVNVDIGSSTTVIFKIPQANANYAVSLTPMNGPNAQTIVTFSDKTTLGFKIHAVKTGTASGTIKVDWVVTPYTN